MLYKIQQTEFATKAWSFVVEYEINFNYLETEYQCNEFKDLEEGFLKLGGENKVCKYSNCSISSIQNLQKNKDTDFISDKFKLYFTSDTYFEKDMDSIFSNEKLKITGMTNTKPIFIGGFDMKNQKAKKMYKGYGAGTVAFLETLNGMINKSQIDNYIGKNCRGFNQVLVLKGDF